MIKKIQRFGSKYNDCFGITYNLSYNDFMNEIKPKMDEFFRIEITASDKGWYYIDLFVGPLRRWKYRLVTNDLTDFHFIRLYFENSL